MGKRQIYCPDCARVIYNFDGFHTSNVNLKCKCGQYFRFIANTNKIVRIDKPVRNTSSGARFW